MKEIFPGIFQWSWFSPEKGYDFNGHLLTFGSLRVLIDPPPFGPGDLESAGEEGPLSHVFLTNRDHVREAETCRKRFHCRVLGPEADAPLIDIPLDGTFRNGDTLPGGMRAVHLKNQKSPGETGFYWTRGAGILILGDALIGHPPGRVSLLPPEKYTDFRAARAELAGLLEFSFDTLLLGDGACILGDARRVLESFLKENPV